MPVKRVEATHLRTVEISWPRPSEEHYVVATLIEELKALDPKDERYDKSVLCLRSLIVPP